MLFRRCLCCGGNHCARECKKHSEPLYASDAPPPVAPNVDELIQKPGGSKRKPKHAGGACPEHMPPRKLRTASTEQVGVELPISHAQPSCLRVRVAGCEYTSLTWHKRGKMSGPKLYRRAFLACGAQALELRNGDTKILLRQGFAWCPPTRTAPDLMPRRARISLDWVDTACSAVRGCAKLQVRKAASDTSGNVILYRVVDLEQLM